MIKMMVSVCRRPGMAHAELIAYVGYVRSAISRGNPVALRRYDQSDVFDSAFASHVEAAHTMTVACDSVDELDGDSAEEMGSTFLH